MKKIPKIGTNGQPLPSEQLHLPKSKLRNMKVPQKIWQIWIDGELTKVPKQL